MLSNTPNAPNASNDPLGSFLSHKRNPCAERISCFTLDNAGYNIGCIVPTVGVEGATIGGEMGV